jgi:hypothetical protein
MMVVAISMMTPAKVVQMSMNVIVLSRHDEWVACIDFRATRSMMISAVTSTISMMSMTSMVVVTMSSHLGRAR